MLDVASVQIGLVALIPASIWSLDRARHASLATRVDITYSRAISTISMTLMAAFLVY